MTAFSGELNMTPVSTGIGNSPPPTPEEQAKIDEQVRALLNTIVGKIGDASEALDAIGEEMINSVEENFAAGGRYSSPDDIVGGGKACQSMCPHAKKPAFLRALFSCRAQFFPTRTKIIFRA